MKTEKKLNQIAEDFSIPEGARPLFIRCWIILSICSGSIMKATMRILEPHFAFKWLVFDLV
jgi:hypothetical protein